MRWSLKLIKVKCIKYVCYVISIENRKWNACTVKSFQLIKCPRNEEDRVSQMGQWAAISDIMRTKKERAATSMELAGDIRSMVEIARLLWVEKWWDL